MTDATFDPYHKWLGIPAAEQPPSHYRLLGLAAFEADGDVIDAAANRQMAFLQTCANGPHAAASQRLLTEVAAARLVLLGGKKDAYDATLRAATTALAVGRPVGAALARPARVVAVAEVVGIEFPELRERPRSRPARRPAGGGRAKLVAAAALALLLCATAALGAWAMFGRGKRAADAATGQPAEVTAPVAEAAGPLTKPAPTAAPRAESEWVPLFNGTDLTGWKTDADVLSHWSVDNGVLIGRGVAGSYLHTERSDFGDFHLRAEARVDAGGNSGLFVRVSPSLGPGVAYEADIKSTDGTAFEIGRLNRSGKPATTAHNSTIRAGQWFTLEVIAKGSRIVVKVDGETTADFTDPSPLAASGHIVLEKLYLATAVDFRKVEVKELTAETPAVAVPRVDTPPPAVSPSKADSQPVVVVKTSLGEFRIELYPDKAPRTVERFLDYVDKGVYENTVFSMVSPGWALLGGGLTPELGPTNRATTLDNERDTGVPFSYGAVAMFEHKGGVAYADFTVSLSDNKGTSEWAFGKVVAGLDVVKKIAAVNTQTRGGYRNVPTPNVVIESVSRARGPFTPRDVPTPAPPAVAPARPPAPLASASEIRQFKGHADIVWGVALSPNGKYALTGSGGGGYADGKFLPATDSTLRLWSVESGKELAKFAGFGAWVTCVAFSPDGRQFVAGSDDSSLRLYDVAALKHVRTFFGHKGAIKVVAFSPDGRTVAAGGGTFNGEADKDFAVRVWQVESGRLAHTLVGHAKGVWGVAFSPDGKRLVSSSWDSTVRVWDAASGRRLDTHFGRGSLSGVAFLAGGRRVAYTQGTELGVFDAFDGTAFPSLKGHDSGVKAVAASPDGKRLVTGGGGGLILLWDAATGAKLGELKGHGEAVTSLAFSKDGRTAISGSFDKTVRLWRLPQ